MTHQINDSESLVEPVPPFNFSWIVPNELAGMGFPKTLPNLEFLIQENVKHLITLSPEMIPPITNFKKLSWYKIDIEEFEAPTLEQIKEFIHICKSCRNKQEAIGLHCRMGRGRTGVMAACYLVHFQDITPQRAVIKIRLQRPGSVETPQQERVIMQYHDFLRTCDPN